MGTKVPSDVEFWRADALNQYVAYLACQPIDVTVLDRMAVPAVEARRAHDDERLIALLRATGDGACQESASRYPGRER